MAILQQKYLYPGQEWQGFRLRIGWKNGNFQMVCRKVYDG